MLLPLIAMHCIDQAHRGSYLDCGVPELWFDGSSGRMIGEEKPKMEPISDPILIRAAIFSL